VVTQAPTAPIGHSFGTIELFFLLNSFGKTSAFWHLKTHKKSFNLIYEQRMTY